MLAGIALCLATTIILKMQLNRAKPRLRYMLVTLLPLLWLLSVTLTAAAEKIWSPDPRIGFIAQTKGLATKLTALDKAAAAGDAAAAKAAGAIRITQFNNRVDRPW